MKLLALHRCLRFTALSLLIVSASVHPLDADLLIQNVNVISMTDDEIQSGRTVVVEGDRIAAIRKAGEAFDVEGETVIDGSGKYLMPGLAEMHAHIPSGDADREYIEDVLFLYLANGITTIRGMLGAPLHLELREQAAQGELVSPRIVTSGPGFSGGSVQGPDHARQRVRQQHEAGYDFLKIFPGLSVDEYKAIADEANSIGMEFSGHIPASVGLKRALKAGQTTIDHLDKYIEAMVADDVNLEEIDDPGVIYFGMHLVPKVDRTKISKVARMTAEAGAWNVPTQALLEHVIGPDDPEELAQRPEFDYMPSETVQQWVNSKKSITGNPIHSEELARNFLQLRRDIIKGLHEEDANLLLGSDAPQIFNVPGFSLHHELQYVVDAGLTPYEALRTGTYNVARYLDNLEDAGTIEEGNEADMVLLESNPLDDVANSSSTAGVIYRGNWLPKAEIEEHLRAIAAKH